MACDQIPITYAELDLEEALDIYNAAPCLAQRRLELIEAATRKIEDLEERVTALQQPIWPP